MIDLLILDLKLPGENGMEIARRIRAESSMPIIMLTDARRKRSGHGAGAGRGRLPDETLFAARLLARIRALLRRSRAHETVRMAWRRFAPTAFAGFEVERSGSGA
jgi:DNA-binding response OmpR family regulator